jgi:hypothetical protein
VPLEIDALSSEPRILLRGSRGSGKTALLHTFAAQLTDRRSQEGTDLKTPLPIYLHVRDVSKPISATTILNSLLRADAMRIDAIESGNAWVMFDGLAGSRAEPEVIDAIAEVVMKYPSNRYILATRAPGLDLPAKGFVYYDLKPPSHEELTAYLELELGEDGRALAAQLVESGLATSPRLIQLAVSNARAGVSARDLLELFVGGTLERLEVEQLQPAVARRLLIMMAKRSEGMLVEPDVLSIGEKLGLSAVEALRYVTFLSGDDAGILVQPRPGSYRFSHDAFSEFFRKID